MDKNGAIDYNEFVCACMKQNYWQSEDVLKSAFDLFDKDNDGKITMDEIKEVLGSELSQIDDEVWKDLMNEVDSN